MQASPVPPSIWTFTVIAAIITTIGTLVGHYLKEKLFAKQFDRWKRKEAVWEAQRKYRDPIVLAAKELVYRLFEILGDPPPDFLRRDALDSDPARLLTWQRNAYFRRYKCQSTIYRLAALLGWLELYRQEVVFLDPQTNEAEQPVDACLVAIREDLADGLLNDTRDSAEPWSDALIFREEQRAVGEAMIVGAAPARTVMGFGAFVAATERREHPGLRWIQVVERFCLDHRETNDFRRVRFQRLLVHSVDLIRCLDSKRVTPWLLDQRAQWVKKLVAAGQERVVVAERRSWAERWRRAIALVARKAHGSASRSREIVLR